MVQEDITVWMCWNSPPHRLKTEAERSYLNYLETDEAVFLPVFGIDTDTKAIAAAEKLFSKPVEPVMIPHLAADGSGLHSISWGMSY